MDQESRASGALRSRQAGEPLRTDSSAAAEPTAAVVKTKTVKERSDEPPRNRSLLPTRRSLRHTHQGRCY